MSLLGNLYAALPFHGVKRPVFILGFGPSGATILGTSLSSHPDVAYLNEPRALWVSAYPEVDIWSSKAPSRGGKLVLDAADAVYAKSKKLSRLLRIEAIKRGGSVLIEKNPANNFRLAFIRHIFPDARFIHIYRNGLEVATSIAKMIEIGGWHGEDAYKWDKLAEYAMRFDETRHLPGLCSTPYEKGLLEWRLSTEAAVRFLRSLPENSFFELNYDEFIDRPFNIFSRLTEFIGIDADPNMASFLAKRLIRRAPKPGYCNVSEKDELIGGPLLPLSMDGNGGLTRRYVPNAFPANLAGVLRAA
ncbi:sulfotransferase family protein [Methylococcus mesophilus]|uniref:sulfotransferase family protein n=1 Tax=Methylococcus mesophilus TaxID=2993564 RepID=UPI00224B3413|nr:sulfotransferase [Methylococcus mesophilus]UZR28182.1 sulfotransferase [Methylococcus mesophilus]